MTPLPTASTSNCPSVLIVDDHQIVCSGIKLIFQTNNVRVETGTCKNGDDCIKMLRSQSYDLIILDVNLPDTDTFQLVSLIKSINADQKILMFSMSSEELYAKRFLQLGALGFISKEASNEEFITAVIKSLEGERYLSSNMMNIIMQDAIDGRNANVFEILTPREFEIMSYFLKGYGSKELANITNLHSSTIGTHKHKILEKLGVKNILELRELATIHNVQ